MESFELKENELYVITDCDDGFIGILKPTKENKDLLSLLEEFIKTNQPEFIISRLEMLKENHFDVIIDPFDVWDIKLYP